MPLQEGKPEALHFGAHLVHTRFETPSAHGRGGVFSSSWPSPASLTFLPDAAYNSSTFAAICRPLPQVHMILTGSRPGME